VLDSAALVVRPDAARVQLDAEPGGGTDRDGDDPPPPPPPPPDAEPTRFYGRTSLEPVRFLRDVGQIAEALVAPLQGLDSSVVRMTVEIEATSGEGFPEGVRRTVSENARTLKFEVSEFEP
jgi:hypothetical protein